MTLSDPAVLEALRYQHRLYESLHLDRLRNTKEGHWVNEAFVVRLYAILVSHGVVGIDHDLEGWEDIDLLRRLRNKIAHTRAEIDDADAKKLDAAIRQRFHLGEQQSLLPGKFVLSKDTVLRPWVAACTAYCERLIRKEAAQPVTPRP